MTRRLAGLAATLTIAALLLGVPTLLWTVGGNPLTALPGIDELGQVLTRPDDGTVLLRLLWYAAWIGWVILAALVLTETIAAIRGVRLPTLPAIAPMQGAARTLVATAALLFIAAPLISLPAPPAQAVPLPDLAPTHAAAATFAPATTPTTVPTVGTGTTTYTVRDGDTLWSIADQFLGHGNRYPEIHQLNRTVVRNPNVIWAGMELRIPITTRPTSAVPTVTPAIGSTSYTVKKGDTLTSIAQRLLGDAARYPEIFEASRHITQPGGYRLTNPDQIDIGWTLHIPATTPNTPEQPAQEQPTNPVNQPPVVAVTTAPAARQRPTTPATPAATATPVTSTASAQTTTPVAATTTPTLAPAPSQTDEPTDTIDAAHAPWLLTGLSMGGALLAAGTVLALRRATRLQYRARRPGRGIRTTDPVLAPVQRSIAAVGNPALPTLHRLDEALRRTGPRLIADDLPFPLIDRVQLSNEGVRLHLVEPCEPPSPWRSDQGGRIWTLPAEADLPDIGPLPPYQPAPWPLLVTLGTDGDTTWLINLEQGGTIHLAGDSTYAADYVRYLTAELAINPWASDITIYTDDTTTSTEQLNPSRFAAGGTTRALQAAEAMTTRLRQYGTDTPRARTEPPDGETWGATALLATSVTEASSLDRVIGMAGTGSALAVVILGKAKTKGQVQLSFTAAGRVAAPELDLMAVGLTADEAAGCAALLAQADNTDDTPIPPAGDEGWRALANQAGAVRSELTTPRNAEPTEDPASPDDPAHGATSTAPVEAASILPDTDETYLNQTATVAADLAELAPRIPANVAKRVRQSDPTLDRDLAWWNSDKCPLPRLTLLGPVNVRAHGTPIVKRKPYYIELIAYLALREHGATTEEVADALGVANATARNAAKTVRDWLGTDPTTGQPHLPDADKSGSAKTRGTPTYQLENVLCDADLFRRLRLRGEATNSGLEDLEPALALVTGMPFGQRRAGGWNWLTPSGMDSHITCAIIDVAHVVATHYLANGDSAKARNAAEKGVLASPDNTISRLDLAAAARLAGHHAEALRIVHDEVCNWADEDGIPVDIDDRARRILEQLGFSEGLRAVV